MYLTPLPQLCSRCAQNVERVGCYPELVQKAHLWSASAKTKAILLVRTFKVMFRLAKVLRRKWAVGVV